MLPELFIGAGVLVIGALIYMRSARARLYRLLTSRLAQITRGNELDPAAMPAPSLPDFTYRFAVLSDFLPASNFAVLSGVAERLTMGERQGAERSYVPTHKQGGTLAYETLIAKAPAIVAFYHASTVRDIISRLVGASVRPTPVYDQSSLSLLIYNKPGDHIGWHFDHNFYRGRHFTMLLTLDNTGHGGRGLSHGVLKARLDEREVEVASAPNTLVVFEGACVRHKVTPIEEGERRLILSMTYCTDPRATWWQGTARRFKDTAYFGVRALWT